MIINKLSSEVELTKYSVSRLKLYDICSQEYKLKYIDRIETNTMSESTILGNICHSVLEEYYLSNFQYGLIEILESNIENILIELKVFPTKCSTNKEIIRDLQLYQKKIYNLYLRSSPEYVGADAIRTRSGYVPTNPTKTSDWKKSVKELKLDELKSQLELLIYTVNQELEGIDLVDIYSQAYYIVSKYTVPNSIIETEAIEMPFGTYDSETQEIINPVFFPPEFAEEPVILNGFIDWVGKVNIDGKIGIAIIDYKTSKEQFTESTVSYNLQLYSYVYAYETITNKKVDYIGIHSLRHNELVIVPVSRHKMEAVLKSLFSKHKYIKNQQYLKRIPDSVYSPCLNQFNKPCSYLKYCYPDVYSQKP